MKHTAHILTILSTLLLLVSCGRGGEMRSRLAALQAANQADSLLTDDSLALALCDYFDSHGTANERMEAHYLLGRTYADLGEAPMAMDQYHHAMERADTTSSDCDFHTLSRVCGQAAILFKEQLLPYEMLEQLELCYHYALLDCDTLMALIAFENRASAYEILGEVDSLMSIRLKAYNLYLTHGYTVEAIRSIGGVIEPLINRNQLETAKQYISAYESESLLFDDENNIDKDHEIYYYVKGLFLLKTGKPYDAESFFRRALLMTTDTNLKESGYYGLFLLYKQINQPDSVAKYAELCYQLADSLYLDDARDNIQIMHSLYNYERHRIAAMNSEARAQQAKLTFYVMLLLLLLVLFVGYHILANLNRKKKLALKQQEIEYENRLKLMQQTQDDLIALQGERYAELANSKNNIIKELQDEIEKHNKLLERFNPQTLDERLHNSDIYKHFYDIAMKPTTRPSEADWMALREMMNREIPRFFSILNSGTKPLKTHEYNLCILIRLGFKSKDYYSIMDIKPNYSAGIRKSLLKRIFGEEGTAEDFNRKILEIG